MTKEYKLKGVSTLALKPGEKQEVEVEGIDEGKVLLVNAGGSIQALGSKCTHYGAPLVKGILTASGRLTCPWHGGKLSPSLSLTTYISLPVSYFFVQHASMRNRVISRTPLPSTPFQSFK